MIKVLIIAGTALYLFPQIKDLGFSFFSLSLALFGTIFIASLIKGLVKTAALLAFSLFMYLSVSGGIDPFWHLL